MLKNKIKIKLWPVQRHQLIIVVKIYPVQYQTGWEIFSIGKYTKVDISIIFYQIKIKQTLFKKKKKYDIRPLMKPSET